MARAKAKAKANAKAKSKTTTDHDQIRRWAEARGGTPVSVKGTSRGKQDPGILRIDFPGYSGEGKLEPLSWDDWFEKFDDSNLALIHQEKTAGGQKSNFNKLVSRDTIAGDEASKGKRRAAKPAKRSSAQRTSAGKNRAKRSTRSRSK